MKCTNTINFKNYVTKDNEYCYIITYYLHMLLIFFELCHTHKSPYLLKILRMTKNYKLNINFVAILRILKH
jgi:hypothetical protein